jgi:hypothetical protein
MIEVKLTPSGRGVASLADRERVSTPAVPERVAPASASRSGPVLRVRCTKGRRWQQRRSFLWWSGTPGNGLPRRPEGGARFGPGHAGKVLPGGFREPGLERPIGRTRL